ncbi:hypothetical protein [Streptomyces sp. ML-6]|uniref:hypothetical protein n=1 Tax=unclassified Streptomyces TaxID=2593676 RepID=UPI0024BFDDCA|nr:hypothetical protein [Streptomyces sp. ML-6]MDK0520962.1 hypothetical protein [Streptomyces sp. ML-6]
MPESHDPLSSLFKEAAATGQARARSAPPSYITERGARAHRRRMVALAVGACLVFSGASAAVVSLLPDSPGTTVPAITPSPAPSPSPSLSPTKPSPSTSSPVSPQTTLPPSYTPSSGGHPSNAPGAHPLTPPETPASPTLSATLPPP